MFKTLVPHSDGASHRSVVRPIDANRVRGIFKEALDQTKAWPFEEARKVIRRQERSGKDEVIFETGYGPSGLPHLGTFAEVYRTSLVRHAYHALVGNGAKSRLIAFSDDMDGLRKAPENVPNRQMLEENIGIPLSVVPDPFGQYASFALHNNTRLVQFLDEFGFDYDFLRASDCYHNGRFNEMLLKVLAHHQEIVAIIAPTLGEARRATYSPFLPICPRTGCVLQVPVIDSGDTFIVYVDPETGERRESKVTGGHCKLQWKVDWAMRWVALGVDYEMNGKDLIDSFKLSSKIARVLGGDPPVNLTYEMFLDEDGEKVSKSKGNGLSIEQWLRYAPVESLSHYLYARPNEAKKLHFDVIPRAVDDYAGAADLYTKQNEVARLGNPFFSVNLPRIYDDHLPASVFQPSGEISYGMVLNLINATGTGDEGQVWSLIRQHAPGLRPETHPYLAEMVRGALAYYRDKIVPTKVYRVPDAVERLALENVINNLTEIATTYDLDGDHPDSSRLQGAFLDAARTVPRYQDVNAKLAQAGRPGVKREWFEAVYACLFGQTSGPRIGGFAELYGVDNTIRLIRSALDGSIRPNGA